VSALIWTLFTLAIALDVAGQTAFKLGLGGVEGRTEGLAFWRALITNPWILAGVAGYVIEGGAWIYVLGHAPLSVVGPMAALAYVGTVLSSSLLLGEVVGPRRWLGTLFVSLGAALLASSVR
jgi:drug/metabolite transporter (DMT)-like permease